MMQLTRRTFAGIVAGGLMGAPLCSFAGDDSPKPNSLAGQVGITTSSFSGHLTAQPKPRQFSLLDLPRIMRDELDMRVIDLNTSSLASEEPADLDSVRAAAEKAGCVITNLKLNQRNVDMNSPHKAVRGRALAVYKKSSEAGGKLRCFLAPL